MTIIMSDNNINNGGRIAAVWYALIAVKTPWAILPKKYMKKPIALSA